MDSGTGRNVRTEIVSPAGNAEKLRFAVRYGADAVYFGGDEFNLRVRSDNFTLEEIGEAVEFCRKSGVKTVFLFNAFLHEKDIAPAASYLEKIKRLNFDAIMVSDPAAKALIEAAGIETEFHLSTQMSVMNHLAVKFWRSAGFKRIVLARETTLDEIRAIRDATDAEIEIFVHGALCVAYSGRCLLSRYLTGRSANQGDCSQPCRWNYSLVEKKRPGNYLDVIEHGSGTEILSSMDLSLIEKIGDYIDAGVSAFKIEGRMKSVYYAANTTRIYRHAVDCAGTGAFAEHLPFWNRELDLISHRPYTNDLFNEFDNIPFESVPYIKKALFMGYRADDGVQSREIDVKVFNPFSVGDIVDAIYPIKETIMDHQCIITDIRSADIGITTVARPGSVYTVTFDRPVYSNALFRKIIK
ncbi:MAG TPA: peptidase U32 family protein [Spirochaetota bacterium]|nr:peptidase U32 family protein [Spirochaetota bacterium]HRZ28750.1 peptidase U32 family protein [Spirochaetota bacterium]